MFGLDSLGLTDINTVTGVYDFVRLCLKEGIKPLVGMELRNGGRLMYVGLARNKEGLAELNRLRTKHNFEKSELPSTPDSVENTIIIYPLESAPPSLKDNEFIGMRPEQLTKLYTGTVRDKLSKMVIMQPVTVSTKKEHNLHRILRAVDNNIVLSKLTDCDYCRPDETMTYLDVLLSRYADYPVIIKNTKKIVDDCSYVFDFTSVKNKRHYTNSRYSDRLLLEGLALDGLQRRYGANNKEAQQRVRREIEVIDQLGFSSYFLITWDIIRFSNSKGFLHVGRGSGANSIVSYCLGITDICPIELNLYFERFLNPSRTSPPDFDIDWSWKERDAILDYIFKRFDTNHVAFVGTNSQFKYRSIYRELGKVFGLPKEELDFLTNTPPEDHDKNKVTKTIHEYGTMLEKFPNQRSMHSCGILISEEPITNFTALEMPPKGFPTAQLDMHITESIGFEKFDILSQRGIGHINDCVKLIESNRGIKVDIRDVNISKDEPGANERLKHGKTLGCFYIESPAMRGLLRRLKCDSYKVLVAASSVIRPGVAQSGMMSEYVWRHNHPKDFQYFHPVFEEHLGETYGVMVYQEDVIKVAHHFAGLDLSDADILRRAMSGKTRSKAEFEGVKQRYFENCAKRGYPEKLTNEVYRQMESFAGYSFCKAHSASYAVESYQSLYLKTYYPIEFMVSVVNNFGGFYRTEVYLHEARMAGGVIHNPCVNSSDYMTNLQGKDIFVGFIHIQSLESSLAHNICEERARRGAYTSLEDFINRVPIGIEALQTLIFVGAFRFTGKLKNELILVGRMLLAKFKPENRSAFLLQEPTKEYKLPELKRSQFEDAFDEVEILGFPISCTPFDLLQSKYRGNAQTADLVRLAGKRIQIIGYLISRKQVPTKQGLMNFGTWIDVNGEYFDTTHFAAVLRQFPFLGGGCYLLEGKVDVDFSFPSIIIERMKKLPFISDPRYEGDKERMFKVHGKIREDFSTTHRAPYPSDSEIGLPRTKMT